MAGSCECGNEPSLLSKDSAPCSLLVRLLNALQCNLRVLSN